ncbi:hypothetical protein FB45DRAFT_921055 [Roridomyces roridus]|uniref:Uncharacterized protein n=1 Tax=Roridomyces roridus TaxID=1738132 RepID=A0AAD7BQ55_9AGAR|nr:hypothetical protein FB45DRAFT_921055 [Roridomyces roridus]
MDASAAALQAQQALPKFQQVIGKLSSSSGQEHRWGADPQASSHTATPSKTLHSENPELTLLVAGDAGPGAAARTRDECAGCIALEERPSAAEAREREPLGAEERLQVVAQRRGNVDELTPPPSKRQNLTEVEHIVPGRDPIDSSTQGGETSVLPPVGGVTGAPSSSTRPNVVIADDSRIITPTTTPSPPVSSKFKLTSDVKPKSKPRRKRLPFCYITQARAGPKYHLRSKGKVPQAFGVDLPEIIVGRDSYAFELPEKRLEPEEWWQGEDSEMDQSDEERDRNWMR